jgi:uncharacterized protein with ATP-grasp and redox domains
MDLAKSPPLMGQYIHRIIRKYSGSSDPYWKVKKKFNSYALKLYPELKEMIESSPNRFETAVSLAIAGNIIDFGVNAVVNQKVIENNIEQALSEPLLGDIESFHEAVDSAEKILYLGDNTGEIVFDRLLIEQLPKQKVTFAVRGSPVINDATMADAVDTKLNDFVTVIDNGSDAPGTVIEECSEPFRQIFYDADIVIAKGQGNFETLSDTEKTIFFLLKAKCPVVSQHIGCSVGDSVISRINHTKSQ